MSTLKIGLVAISLVASYAYLVESSNIRSAVSNKRRPAQEGEDRLAQASNLSGLQPYESLEVLQGKYGPAMITDPMSTAASYHHKKGTKGWLDMGAWTKKKGAFGWYADYPVGKGR